MTVRTWSSPTQHGEARQELHQLDERSGGLVVLLPGQAYSCERPLLHYARLAALGAGFNVLAVQYGFQAAHVVGARSDTIGDLADEVLVAAKWAREEAPDPPQILVIAKSLGTAVAREMLRRAPELGSVRSLLMTPVPQSLSLMPGGLSAAIIGTVDPLFSEPSIQSSIHDQPDAWTVLEGVDHGLEAPGDVEGSVAALADAVRSIQAFLQRG